MAQNEKYLEDLNIYIDNLKELKDKEVVVGIPQSSNSKYEDDEVTNLSLAEIGYIHEFGSPENGIPQRSFLRVPLMSNVERLFKQINKDIKFAKMNTNIALGRLGVKGVSIVLGAFDTQNNGRWEELKPSTIAQRKDKGVGGVQPLVDSGQTRRAITHEVRNANTTNE